MSRIYELLRQAEQERRVAVPEMPPAAVDHEQTNAAAASVADLAGTGHEKMPRMAPQVFLGANDRAPRPAVFCGVDDDAGPRTGAAPASTERLPDLQAFLATAYLLSENRQPLSTKLAPAGAAQLFSSLVSLQRQAADLELEMDEVLASVAHHARALTRADAAAVALLQDNGVVCRGRAGLKAPALGTCVNLRSSFTGLSFCTREVLYCEDTKNDPRVNQTACSVAGIRSIFVVPVEQDQQSIGIVEVFSASPARFGISERYALVLLACVVADAIRARAVVGLPPPREPVAAACEVAPLATTLTTAKTALTPAPQEIRQDVAVTSELPRSGQEIVAVRRTRHRSLFRL